jgi:predicted dehydrogenase
LPVAVVGCGRMGRLHARVYSQMPQVRLVGVYDADAAKAQETAEQYGTRAVGDPAELLPLARAVTIAVPTRHHLSVAQPFLARGIACLIEKPLASDVAECRRIMDLASQSKAVVQVGHIERFNPAVRAMSRLDIRPWFIEVDRVSPLTFRSIDVGVVLDMMIHDIDIVLHMARSPLARLDAVGVSVTGQAEDICNARLIFENGCVANLTASRLALKTERRLRVFSPDAYVSLDYQKKRGTLVRRTGNVDAVRDAVDRIRSGEITDISELNYQQLLQIEELKIDDTEPLRAELEAFAAAATGAAKPIVSVEDGLAAVEVAQRIVAAIKTPPL